MANETEYSNFVTVAAYVASEMSPYFRAAVVTEPLITVEAPVAGSNTKKFGKSGNLTAAIIAESASITKSELTDTSVTPTLQKVAVYVELTDEAESFAGATASMQRLAQEAGLAAASKFDTDVLALSAGLSQSSGTTNTTLTEAKLDTAIYKVRLGNVTGEINAVLHPTQIRDIRQAVIASTATFFTGGANQTLAQTAQRNDAGFAGKYLDVKVYESSNVPSANAGVDWLGMVFTKSAFACVKTPGFKQLTNINVQYALKQLALIGYYGVIEWNDGAGCGVVSKQ